MKNTKKIKIAAISIAALIFVLLAAAFIGLKSMAGARDSEAAAKSLHLKLSRATLLKKSRPCWNKKKSSKTKASFIFLPVFQKPPRFFLAKARKSFA